MLPHLPVFSRPRGVSARPRTGADHQKRQKHTRFQFCFAARPHHRPQFKYETVNCTQRYPKYGGKLSPVELQGNHCSTGLSGWIVVAHFYRGLQARGGSLPEIVVVDQSVIASSQQPQLTNEQRQSWWFVCQRWKTHDKKPVWIFLIVLAANQRRRRS